MPTVPCLTSMLLLQGGHKSPDSWRPDSAGFVDHDSLPLRCHWGDEAHEALCGEALGYLEDAWLAQVDGAGFVEPLPDDDGLLDLYMTSQSAGGGAYAYGPCSTSEVEGRQGCHAYMVIDPEYVPALLDLTVAHEFNHVLQYATDFEEPTLPFWEATATAAQRWTYPDSGLDLEYLEDFQTTPWVGLLGDGYKLWDDYEIWSYYEYGAAIWIMHLEATWGDGTGAGGAALWWAARQEGSVNEPDVIDAYDTVSGDWVAALVELSMDRALLGTEDAPAWGAELTRPRFGVVPDADLVVDDLPTTVSPEYGPWPTGTSYVFLEGVPVDHVVSIEAVDPNGGNWALFVMEDGARDWTTDGALSWETAGGSLVLGAVSLGAEDFDADLGRLVHAELGLEIAVAELAGEDPDSAVGDTGEVDEDEKRCGCSGSAASLVWLGLVALGLRRRGLSGGT